MCSLRDMTSSDLECTSQVLSSLHVTIMDILRQENEKQVRSNVHMIKFFL